MHFRRRCCSSSILDRGIFSALFILFGFFFFFQFHTKNREVNSLNRCLWLLHCSTFWKNAFGSIVDVLSFFCHLWEKNKKNPHSLTTNSYVCDRNRVRLLIFWLCCAFNGPPFTVQPNFCHCGMMRFLFFHPQPLFIKEIVFYFKNKWICKRDSERAFENCDKIVGQRKSCWKATRNAYATMRVCVHTMKISLLFLTGIFVWRRKITLERSEGRETMIYYDGKKDDTKYTENWNVQCEAEQFKCNKKEEPKKMIRFSCVCVWVFFWMVVSSANSKGRAADREKSLCSTIQVLDEKVEILAKKGKERQIDNARTDSRSFSKGPNGTCFFFVCSNAAARLHWPIKCWHSSVRSVSFVMMLLA